jgi:hypothetical protein
VVAISSMDVHRAYGRFCRLEEGEVALQPFDEDAPLRSRLFAYRAFSAHQEDLNYRYDKFPQSRSSWAIQK